MRPPKISFRDHFREELLLPLLYLHSILVQRDLRRAKSFLSLWRARLKDSLLQK